MNVEVPRPTTTPAVRSMRALAEGGRRLARLRVQRSGSRRRVAERMRRSSPVFFLCPVGGATPRCTKPLWTEFRSSRPVVDPPRSYRSGVDGCTWEREVLTYRTDAPDHQRGGFPSPVF